MLSFSLEGRHPVDLFFADDSCRLKPHRPGMNALVAVGGIRVESEHLGSVHKALDELCRKKYFFPEGEEFKWSPSRTSWMARELTDRRRRNFYLSVIEILREHEVVAAVMVSASPRVDSRSISHATNEAIKFYLERVEQQCQRRRTQGLIIVDRPGGGSRQEAAFLTRCKKLVEGGTTWVKFEHIAHGLLAADSRTSRLLQAADLIVSCTSAAVAGEQKYALPVFDAIGELLDRSGNRVQGYGLKIDSDNYYANLFYWLLATERFWQGGSGMKLPQSTLPWATDPLVK